MKKKLFVLSIAALLASLAPSCAFAQQPRNDPMPFDPFLSNRFPREQLPGDPLPGDPLPGDPLPGDPLRFDPFRIGPLDRDDSFKPELPWERKQPEGSKPASAKEASVQIHTPPKPSPEEWLPKLPRWLIVTGSAFLAVLLGLSLLFRRKILRFFLRITLSKKVVKTTAAKILEIRSGRGFQSISVKHQAMGDGKFTGFGWLSPVFFVTETGRREALKCPPRDAIQILKLVRALGTEQGAHGISRRYTLTFEQVTRLAERA